MKHQPPAAAASFIAIAPDAETPTFEELAADAEIAALLDFDPVPRRCRREDGWTDEMQRMFIARLARNGSPGKACDELGKARSGIDKMARKPAAKSFRAAWDGAVALAERRRAENVAAGHASVANIKLPFVDNRRTSRSRARNQPAQPLPGQVLNEHDEYEDQASFDGRVADVRVRWTEKFLHARRLYLGEISPYPFKRVAFEILTRYPIDWDKAERLEAQDDEPWRVPMMREPAMLLTAENGWMGEMLHGEDKLSELRTMLNAHLIEQGEEPLPNPSKDSQ